LAILALVRSGQGGRVYFISDVEKGFRRASANIANIFWAERLTRSIESIFSGTGAAREPIDLAAPTIELFQLTQKALFFVPYGTLAGVIRGGRPEQS
jgi:hypothetical protein